MESQKIENLLNISLDATEEEREKSANLDIGYDRENNTWELIVKYNGDIQSLKSKYPQITIYELLNEYAILRVPQEIVQLLAQETVIEYIEKPKQFYFELYAAKTAACINSLQSGRNSSNMLFGENVIVAVIDTGIDIFDSDFRNADGTTRIESIWDQTSGRFYSRADIDATLAAGRGAEINKTTDEAADRADLQPIQKVETTDPIGHGTSVARIACGNNGVASRSSIIIVKLGIEQKNAFPRTTQIMQAVDYAVKKGIELNMPVSINLSFGNNYGDHSGNSLLERFLDDISNYWKNCICVGAGNEGQGRTHAGGVLNDNDEAEVQFAVSEYETGINIQIWKEYWDEVDVELIAPTGKKIGPIRNRDTVNRYQVNGTEILSYYGEPSPYNMTQEVYFDFIPQDSYILSGIWTLRLIPRKIVSGRYDMWMPAIAALNEGTGFLNADSNYTFTIPSTASRVISVAAYDSRNNSYAAFSGRGYAAVPGNVKPDLAAPGVDITLMTPRGITSVTGTSFATPFVTGGGALLMEWGIVKENDPFLYGDDCDIIGLNQRKALKQGRFQWFSPIFMSSMACPLMTTM